MKLPSFDLRLVRPFSVLADELHLGRAAARLGLAQAALSQQIGRLERQLGTPLVEHTSRQVTLTPAGARFLAESRAILTRAARVETDLRRGGGELRIAATYPVLRGILTSFAAANPLIAMTLVEHSPTAGLRALVDGAVDVGFEVPEGVPPGMSYAVVFSAPMGAACAATHPLAERASAAWADLEGERILIAPAGIADGLNTTVRNALRRAAVRTVDVVGPPVNRAVYLIETIASGRGIVIMPSSALDPVPPGVAWVPLHPRQDLELAVVWNDRDPTASVRRFVASARDTPAAVRTA